MVEQVEYQRIRPRLYLISPPQIVVGEFVTQLSNALTGGDVACLQLRLKDVDDDTIRNAAMALAPVCAQHDVALIINDRPDLAAALDADGVHVGQEDTSYAEARNLLGAEKIIGVTCHNSRHLAMQAAEAGADYVAFGAFFETTTKSPKTTATTDILKWWADIMEVPCVAIGGITIDNCLPLLEAGADFVAVSSGVWKHANGHRAAVAKFNAIIDTHEEAWLAAREA